MADVVFNAQVRENAGKGAARATRREGRVPAVIYGKKKDPLNISLHPVELEKALDLVGFYDADIEIDVDGKKHKVTCQDVQFHPVTDMPLHVDFLRK
jgi:large subunit ribosomal protein L25